MPYFLHEIKVLYIALAEISRQHHSVRIAVDVGLQVAFLLAVLAPVMIGLLGVVAFQYIGQELGHVRSTGCIIDTADIEGSRDGHTVLTGLAQIAQREVLKVDTHTVEIGIGVSDG